MNYYTTNPSSSTPHSQSRQGIHLSYPSRSANISPQSNKKRRMSPNRLPHRISFSLVSLVTKFEALDALSLPFTTPSLQPAPLQISRSSLRQKGITGTNFIRRLSTIFSPKRGSTENYDQDLSEEDFQAARGAVFGSSKSRKVDGKQLRKAQASYKPSSIRLRGGVWDPADALCAKGIGAVTAPYVRNEIPQEKKGRSIRDKINFYDGAVTTGNNTQAYPSANNTAAPNTPVSLSRNRLFDRSYFLTPSTGGSKRTCLHIPDADALTSTKSNPPSTARQHIKIGPAYNRLDAQNSPTRSSLSDVTPRTTNSTRQYRNVPDSSRSRLILRQGRMPGQTRGRRNAMLAAKPSTILGVGGDGSAPPSLVGQDHSIRPLGRRRFSNKIDELYRAKSLEKKRDDAQGITQQQESHVSFVLEDRKAQKLERRMAETQPSKLSGSTRSKVAAMRKIFDGKFSPRSASPDVSCCGLDPFLDAIPFPTSRQREEVPRLPDVPPPKTPTTPPMPLAGEAEGFKITSNLKKASAVNEVASVLDRIKTEVSHSSSPIKRISPPKSKFIGDKLKIFETAFKDASDSPQPSRRKEFRRRLSRSLRGLFEAPPRKSQEEESEKTHPVAGSAKQQRALSPDGNGVVSKRGTVVGRWNKLPTAVSNGGDGTASENQLASPAEEEDFADIVVRGVECGLKQPRPVRAVEMKRMAILCRDRMGEIMDREKGRVSQRRKL